MTGLFAPIGRAVAQFDDPVFQGVVWRGLAWSALAFAALLAGGSYAAGHIAQAVAGSGLWGAAWIAATLAGAGAVLLAFWLFLPVAGVIGTLYVERIARAVERRYYPAAPPGTAAPVLAQAWDGLAVGARILLLQLLTLVLVLFIPGIGLVLGWAVTAYAIGRGLFVAVAMRRLSRPDAEALYRRNRTAVLVQGGVVALAAYVPLVNLLVPILGTAAMVHVLDRSRP